MAFLQAVVSFCWILSLPVLAQVKQSPDKAVFVSYCELVQDSEKYSGKTIQTRAILVEVVAPTADGYTILYRPECEGKNNRTLVADNAMLNIPEKEHSKLNHIFRKKGSKQLLARAEITVSGKFKLASDTYLNKPKFILEIIKIEHVKEVETSLPWPL